MGDNTNWGSTEPLDSWYGVLAPSHIGRVTQLALGANNLVGTLPAALGNLDQMQWLYLWGNELTGSIPASLGDLALLHELYLWGNQLEGDIPASLGDLTHLRQLYLNENNLSGPIPATVGNLTELQELGLWNNQLTGGIPASLNSLANLKYLYLGGNALSGTIPDLSSLTKLLQLSLSDNGWSGVAPGPRWATSPTCTWLDISRNSLDGADSRPGHASQACSGCTFIRTQLSGEIPDSLGNNFASLVHLYLEHATRWRGPIPATLGRPRQPEAPVPEP